MWNFSESKKGKDFKAFLSPPEDNGSDKRWRLRDSRVAWQRRIGADSCTIVTQHESENNV